MGRGKNEVVTLLMNIKQFFFTTMPCQDKPMDGQTFGTPFRESEVGVKTNTHMCEREGKETPAVVRNVSPPRPLESPLALLLH